ncbi:MAG: aldo/keto reductase [Chloroflexi bacterium]|nr:aldo/keto reductase [Chloroflexota bacterium]
MKKQPIPQTDLETSRIAYGTWHLGGGWDSQPVSQEIIDRADRLLHAAVEHGITLIDLADIYTRGKSDKTVGEVIRRDPGLRDKVLLQEKVGIRFGDDPNPGDPGRYDFSYQHLTRSVETCLERLNTDYVDLLLLHRPDPLIEPEEVARAFESLHSSGKVRYFGVSNHTGMQIELLKKFVTQPLVVNQIELNVLHNDLITDGIVANTQRARYTGARDTLDYCRVNDILVQAWSPVAGGSLFAPGDDVPDNVKQTAAEIARLAVEHNTSKEAVAVAWLLRHPARIQPILGTLNVQRLAESVRADDLELSREEWYRLLAAANGASVP